MPDEAKGWKVHIPTALIVAIVLGVAGWAWNLDRRVTACESATDVAGRVSALEEALLPVLVEWKVQTELRKRLEEAAAPDAPPAPVAREEAKLRAKFDDKWAKDQIEQRVPRKGDQMELLKQAKEPTETEGIRLTETAAKKIKEILADAEEADHMYLYIGVKGGGCSGLEYVMDLRHVHEKPLQEMDEVFASQDVVVVSDVKSYVVGALGGMEVDYTENLMGGGFVFNNPNAKFHCGCNKSYGV